MAECFPDTMPRKASKAEKLVFSVLSRLPDDCVVYYEPSVKKRRPDFVVLLPETGLLVIEVKGWYASSLLQASCDTVTRKTSSGDTSIPHPLRQAREYVFRLIEACRGNLFAGPLMQSSGRYQGHLVFPVGHGSAFPYIAAEDLQDFSSDRQDQVFPEAQTLFKEDLALLEGCKTVELRQRLKRMFDPWWPFPALDTEQINLVRGILHPEISFIVPRGGNGKGTPPQPSAVQEPTPDSPAKTEGGKSKASQAIPVAPTEFHLFVLDMKQERHARSIGSGHRLLYGVAGSGKTVILIARARLLAANDPSGELLMLCFNITLAAYLEGVMKDLPNVHVYHFDGWAKKIQVSRKHNEDDHRFGMRLLTRLSNGLEDTARYKAVLIDEAQDFEPSWFQCALTAMQDPKDGDLLIVGDGNQSIRKTRKITWKSLGIQAAGRTVSSRFGLDINYRNSREILTVAARLLREQDSEEDREIAALQVDPAQAKRSTGHDPVILRSSGRLEECRNAYALIRDLLRGKWQGADLVAPLQPDEIGVIYPALQQQDRADFQQFVKGLRKLAPVVWLTEDQETKRHVDRPGIKIQTIHSAKGLQYRAVILLWSDILPRDYVKTTENDERRLLYVALTRAEEFLAILHSSPSVFIGLLGKEPSASCASDTASRGEP